MGHSVCQEWATLRPTPPPRFSPPRQHPIVQSIGPPDWRDAALNAQTRPITVAHGHTGQRQNIARRHIRSIQTRSACLVPDRRIVHTYRSNIGISSRASSFLSPPLCRHRNRGHARHQRGPSRRRQASKHHMKQRRAEAPAVARTATHGTPTLRGSAKLRHGWPATGRCRGGGGRGRGRGNGLAGGGGDVPMVDSSDERRSGRRTPHTKAWQRGGRVFPSTHALSHPHL